MDKIYTELQFIKYYYGECDLFETLEIEYALSEDFQLHEWFTEIQASLNELDAISESPSDLCLQNIFAYSENYPLEA
jgi:hypothetical protein